MLVDHFGKMRNLFNVPDAAAAIRDYASQGFNLVIAHGSQYKGSVQEIAKEFPKVAFAWGTDVNTFNDAVRGALRHDPDVIYIGGPVIDRGTVSLTATRLGSSVYLGKLFIRLAWMR